MAGSSGNWAVPTRATACLTADTPFQIHDIDGDGRNEVVMVKDFKLQVLEGNTGRLRKWVWMPTALPDNGKKPFTLTNGDSLAFLNLSGTAGRREFLVKDRYSNFWTFDSDLERLWQGEGQTGHYPYPFDFDGDGRDELAIGYALWDHRGRQLWSHDAELDDHADGVAVGNFSGDPNAEPRVLRMGQRRGFPDVRPPRQDPEARADRTRPDRQRRQVPPRPAGAATHVHQLLEEPRHRLAVRPRRQPAGASMSRSIPAARCCR